MFKRLHNAGVLKNLVLVGSWCLFFYRQYFERVGSVSAVKTRDLDFLVPLPHSFVHHTDLPEILKDLGFIVSFKGNEGYMILQHPELMVEFLVTERGRGRNTPYPLPELGMNAQSLRFLDIALIKTMKIDFEGIPVVVPHPAVFAIHKLLVAQRRRDKAKTARDCETAVFLMKLLVKNKDESELKGCWLQLPGKWKKSLLSLLNILGETEISKIFQ